MKSTSNQSPIDVSQSSLIKPESGIIKMGVLLAFVIIPLLAGISVIYYSRIANKQLIDEQSAEILLNASKEAAEHTRGFLRPASRVTTSTKDLLALGLLSLSNTVELENYFITQLQSNPEISGLYVGTTDGRFIYTSRQQSLDVDDSNYRTKLQVVNQQNKETTIRWLGGPNGLLQQSLDPGDDYDHTSRPWYQKAESTKAQIWTEPYVFFTSKREGVTVAAPYYNKGGALLGVVGVDIELSSLSDFLNTLQIGDLGNAFIITDSGLIVASEPEIAYPGKRAAGNSLLTISQSDQPSIISAYEKFTQRKENNDPLKLYYDVEGKNHFAVFLPFDVYQNDPWYVGVVSPSDMLFAEAKTNQLKNLLMLCVVLIISGLVGWFIARRSLLKPVAVLHDQAIKDQLTGVYNRHHLFEVSKTLIQHARISNKPISLSILDLDFFKEVNDTYGHRIGDEVLIGITRLLTSELRKSDVIARYGGEEFIILLPDTELSTAKVTMNRILETLNQNGITTTAGYHKVTFSAGITTVGKNHLLGLKEAVDLADSALYQAKHAGRNRIIAKTNS